jgi:hypothetical protein
MLFRRALGFKEIILRLTSRRTEMSHTWSKMMELLKSETGPLKSCFIGKVYFIYSIQYTHNEMSIVAYSL